MKHPFLALLAGLTLALALALPAAAPAAPAIAKPQPAAAQTTESHREIRNAIASLQQARDHLANADQDFGGHRTPAIHAIDQAMLELRLCQQYEKD
jgi:hypothetical protein